MTIRSIYYYVVPRHTTRFLNFGQAISKSKHIEIDYEKTKDKAIVTRKEVSINHYFRTRYIEISITDTYLIEK